MASGIYKNQAILQDGGSGKREIIANTHFDPNNLRQSTEADTTVPQGGLMSIAGALYGTIPQASADNVRNDALAQSIINGGTTTPTTEKSSSNSSVSYSASAYDPTADYMNAYNARQKALNDNYQAALGQLKRSYEDSVNSLKNQGDDALRQAYINMMMNKRGLNQSLEAAGLTGGASESAMANLYNTYANDRNEIARAVQDNLTELGNNYGQNVSNLGMNYNTNYADALADYQNQLATAKKSLANTLAKTYSNSSGTTVKADDTSDYLTETANALNRANENYYGTGSNSNTVNYIRNLNSPVAAYNYVKGLNVSDEEKEAMLINAGYDMSQIASIIAGQNQ